MTAALAAAVYLTGWLMSSRRLYCAWRPGRTSLCGTTHWDYQGNKTGHTGNCYRRRRPDLTAVHIDTDAHAIAWAMFASVAWPVLLLAHLLRHQPPALPEEREKALADREAAVAKAEREAGIG